LEKKNSAHTHKKNIRERYNSSAPFYDRRYKRIQNNKYVQLFSGFELKGKIIFDAGCGTGLMAKFFIEQENRPHLSNWSLVGVDISDKMLKEFSEKFKSPSLVAKRISLIQADLENLPLRANKFNTLISITAYQNLGSIKEGVEESVRISKNMANAYISVLKKKIDQSIFLSLIDDVMTNIKVFDNQSIEDLIIEGLINKH
jgi:ubiquinone/menaquinone biosynthesis C-methylase UbiE